MFNVGVGFFAWHITRDLLEGKVSWPETIELKMEYRGSDDNENTVRKSLKGPKIIISYESQSKSKSDENENDRSTNGNDSKSEALFITVPIVVAVIVALVGLFFWKRKNFGNKFKRSNCGYGVGQSLSQRIGKQGDTPRLGNKGPAYELDRSLASPTERNVFRE